jgi:threonine dehydratase
MVPLSTLHSDCHEAAGRIAAYVRHTPVEYSHALSQASGADVYLKLENLQTTGSFKLRGATNAILSLGGTVSGVVAASSGNHGMAVAHAAQAAGLKALIFVPEAASPSKLEAIEALGAEIETVEGDPILAEAAARQHADKAGLPYLSPYNDVRVVAGQGTIGVELASDMDRTDVLFASMGGGGLIAGAGGYLKETRGTHVVACSPVNSAIMHESLQAGRIVDLPSFPTLSDGTAGGVEPEAITFKMCQEIVDESLTVSEDEIRVAMRLIIGRHHTLIEGSAAVAVAGFLQTADRWSGQKVAIVLCGANVGIGTLKKVL